ncbi:methylenetetrahydrofolate reductase [Amnibacterium sp.]|uniref:methylenetetrahydrofolate reductase n=1 Tax=Amnibacterium sp. TaxID=1872496 RepID=UPI003F7CD224
MPMDGHRVDAVGELLTDWSLEMTGKDVQAPAEARPWIPDGTRVNITFLGNEDLDLRLGAVRAVLDQGLVPVPHLSARRLASTAQLEEYLSRLEDVGGSEHVFVVGGDPAAPEGPYDSALAVVRSGLLGAHGVREVGVAGYPEGHPDIASEVLQEALLAKTAEIAEQGLLPSVITQFAFDADAVTGWIRNARRSGVDAPIRVGTPGPAGVKRLLAFARRFGVRSNATIVRKYGFSLANLMGTAGPDAFVGDLADRVAAEPALGPVAVHLYTFGGIAASARWVDERLRTASEARR